MNNRLSSFSIIIAFLCLTLIGFFFIPKLSVKLTPSTKQPIVSVHFNMWGQSSKIVESEVTSKMEAMFNRVKGVQSLHSFSRQGGGYIMIYLSEHIDPEIARFEISTIIRQLWNSLPEGVSYPTIEMSGLTEENESPFLRYTINAPFPPVEIQEFADNSLRHVLAEIEGIKKVDIHGAGRRIYKLEYDFHKLQNYGISIDNIRTAINAHLSREFMGMGNYVGEDRINRLIRVNLISQTEKKDFDPSHIQVVNNEGEIIYLDKLVTMSFEEDVMTTSFRINGLNSIYLSITADENSNQLILSRKIQKILDEQKPVLPLGYELHLTYDESEYIEKELNKTYFRSGLTIMILLAFVFLMYRNIRYSLIIIASLVSSISISAILYYLLNIEIHLISLAGFTISITLIIDNFIIMSDHIIQHNNRNSFFAILAATITTICALSVIFFLDKNTQITLVDFAMVVIINLTISLVVALLLVPALIDQFKLHKKEKQSKSLVISNRKKKKYILIFNRIYEHTITFMSKKKVKRIIIPLLILAFGLPVFLLPEQLEEEKQTYYNDQNAKQNSWIAFYNKTVGSDFYRENLKQAVDIIFGGTMRLFVQHVKDGTYSSMEKQETALQVMASLPNGSTKEQMDDLIKKMEKYISQFDEIRQFETSIQSGQRASIKILFKKEYQRGAFPNLLYDKVISQANEMGGGSWSVYGVGDGFNNEIKEKAGSSRIKLLGYNYDVLNTLANEMRDSLLRHSRIKEVIIDSEFSFYKNDYSEFTFNIDKEKLVESNLFPVDLFTSLFPVFQQDLHIATWVTDKKSIPIKLHSKSAKELDIWNLKNYPGRSKQASFYLSEIVNIEKRQTPQDIAKEDQQYRLCVQYEYIGNYNQTTKVMYNYVNMFNKKAPLGFKAESESFIKWWNEGETSQYWLLLIIALIIFFTTSILFNSLKQPFVVLFIIPLSFIGIFLTFYLFDLNFDKGGFAAFILLMGLSINSNIYIIYEYRNIRKDRPELSPMKAYIKAWNLKVRPIVLTILSTILGFIPFMVSALKESFWFPLAAGTIGGLIVSFIALFFLLPVFMKIAINK